MMLSERFYLTAIIIAATTFACANVSFGAGQNAGEKCHVKASDGKTHSGTYSNDVDGLNCSGSWGAVACGNHDCKNGPKTGGASTSGLVGGGKVSSAGGATKPVANGGAMKPITSTGTGGGTKH